MMHESCKKARDASSRAERAPPQLLASPADPLNS